MPITGGGEWINGRPKLRRNKLSSAMMRSMKHRMNLRHLIGNASFSAVLPAGATDWQKQNAWAKILLLGLFLSAMNACSLLSRKLPGGGQYMLDPAPIAKIEGPQLFSVIVRRFSSVPPYDGLPFLYKLANGGWRADSDNGWLADPADMFCDAYASALEDSKRFSMVGVEGVTVQFDYAVEGVIEALYADYTNEEKPFARAEIRVYLLDRRDSRPRLVASVSGAGNAPILGDAAVGVAVASSEAARIAITQTIELLINKITPIVESTAAQVKSLSPDNRKD